MLGWHYPGGGDPLPGCSTYYSKRRHNLFIYKRKIGQKVLAGNDVVIAVKGVSDASGKPIREAVVSLGFALPSGMRMQRGEQFLEEYEELQTMPFPMFYRQVSISAREIQGYALTLPLEQQQGVFFEAVASYDDMTEDDHPITICYFRSEAEVRAFESGLQHDNLQVSASVTEKRDGLFLVLVDKFEYYSEPDVNPRIRNITAIDPIVLRALKPERR